MFSIRSATRGFLRPSPLMSWATRLLSQWILVASQWQHRAWTASLLPFHQRRALSWTGRKYRYTSFRCDPTGVRTQLTSFDDVWSTNSTTWRVHCFRQEYKMTLTFWAKNQLSFRDVFVCGSSVCFVTSVKVIGTYAEVTRWERFLFSICGKYLWKIKSLLQPCCFMPQMNPTTVDANAGHVIGYDLLYKLHWRLSEMNTLLKSRSMSLSRRQIPKKIKPSTEKLPENLV